MSALVLLWAWLVLVLVWIWLVIAHNREVKDLPTMCTTTNTSGSWTVEEKSLKAKTNDLLERLGEPVLGKDEQATIEMYIHLKKLLQGE